MKTINVKLVNVGHYSGYEVRYRGNAVGLLCYEDFVKMFGWRGESAILTFERTSRMPERSGIEVFFECRAVTKILDNAGERHFVITAMETFVVETFNPSGRRRRLYGQLFLTPKGEKKRGIYESKEAEKAE